MTIVALYELISRNLETISTSKIRPANVFIYGRGPSMLTYTGQVNIG
jgi:hypothetical protein